tara:strand:- start:435 stop:833 length:399 start_codon:yes stop_codon:yes gene_type:complete
MAGPFKMKAGKEGPMKKNFGISPVKQNFISDIRKTNKVKGTGITKGDGGYSYKIDYRTKEGDNGDGTSDAMYRAPHIYSSKDGGKFSQVKTGSDAYKAIKKKHYSPQFENMPMPKGKKGGFNISDAMEFMKK